MKKSRDFRYSKLLDTLDLGFKLIISVKIFEMQVWWNW